MTQVVWQDFPVRGAIAPMNSTLDLFPHSVRRHLRLAAVAIAGSLAVFLMAGCSGAQVVHTYDADGNLELTKRRAVHETFDDVYHCTRTVYYPASKRLHTALDMPAMRGADATTTLTLRGLRCPEGRLSADQAALILELAHGPDYVRPAFCTPRGEKAVEWLFMKDHLVAQFVGGELVYRGELSGRETLLLKRGYPDYIMSIHENVGPDRENFIYRNWAGTHEEVYGLSNDRLSVSVE